MKYTKLLRAGMYGNDVQYVKERLLQLGMYETVTEFKKPTFYGSDTKRAVIRFQQATFADPKEWDGVVGPLTWAALFGESQPVEVITTPGFESLDRFGDAIKSAIVNDLLGVSDTRREMCLDALQFAIDPNNPGKFPRSLYIRGGNIYNTDLTPNVITVARIRSGAARQPEFYDGGRQEMMELAVADNPLITGADCSGGVVGLHRHAGVVKPTFDLSANGFDASSSYTHINRDELKPGDLLHKPGHIGMYVGGGYGVEWMGGAYGCQLTRVDGRRGWNYVKRKLERPGKWENFLRAKRY